MSTRQPERIKAYRDTREVGILSYLTYLGDRLAAARDRLTGSGGIFVRIGERNVRHLRELLDGVFGAENCFGDLIFFKAGTGRVPAVSPRGGSG